MDKTHESGVDGGGSCFVHEGQESGTPSSQRAIEKVADFSVKLILAIVSSTDVDALKYEVASGAEWVEICGGEGILCTGLLYGIVEKCMLENQGK